VNETIDNYLRSISETATGGSKCFVLDYGINEKELESNFNTLLKVCETLNENDEVFIDITHSFSSIPLFIYSIRSYKHIKI